MAATNLGRKHKEGRTMSEETISKAKEKVLKYIKSHAGTDTSDIIVDLNNEFNFMTVIDALDLLYAEGKIYPKDKPSVTQKQSGGVEKR